MITIKIINHFLIASVINKMIKFADRTPLSRVELLQLDSLTSSPLKRNLKISNQKFPSDFFKDVRESRERGSIFQSMSKINGEGSRICSRNLPQTHQEIRNMGHETHEPIDQRRREMNTALEYRGQGQVFTNRDGKNHNDNKQEYQQLLIKSVLTTAREMKKMIRKHSIELKKDRDSNRDEGVVELPPLKLRRGFTTAF